MAFLSHQLKLAPPEDVIATMHELEAAAPPAPDGLTPPNDIGRFVTLDRLSDEQLMLTDRWRPSCREELPSSTAMKSGKPVTSSLTLDQSKKPWVGVSHHGVSLPTLATIKPCLTLYESHSTVETELKLWCKRWARHEGPIPTTVLECIECANGFPIVTVLLSVLAVIPVTSCTPERLFSKVGTTLTKIRSTMTVSRLQDIILIQSYRGHLPTTEEVLHRFVSHPGRRGHFF